VESRKGRPKIYKGRDPKKEILETLPQTGEKITFSEWKKRVLEKGISNTTFTKYRHELESEYMIIRIVDTESQPPRVYFKRNPDTIVPDFAIIPLKTVKEEYLKGKPELFKIYLAHWLDKRLRAIITWTLYKIRAIGEFGSQLRPKENPITVFEAYLRYSLIDYMMKIFIELLAAKVINSEVLSEIAEHFFDPNTILLPKKYEEIPKEIEDLEKMEIALLLKEKPQTDHGLDQN